MPKAFFAHAGEDKVVVEAVYQRVLASSPDLAAWLDKYEILAGESLLERIAAGMDESDKFVIFLSPESILKPWVNRELRRAIMREIQGVDPHFIIPVLIGDITAVPAFLEDKKYIAIHKMTEEEWLAELTAAIRGLRPTSAAGAMSDNIVVRPEGVPGKPNVIRIVFEARHWPAKVTFGVNTTEDIVESHDEWPGAAGTAIMHSRSVSRHPRGFAICAETPQIRPGYPVVYVLEFEPGIDAIAAIQQVGHWNPI